MAQNAAHEREALVASVEEAIEVLRAGRMLVVVDDDDPESAGYLVVAAEFATPNAINFMAKEGGGIVCLALRPERCEELGLNVMTARNRSRSQTPFTISIDAREGISTGISAHDRARTVQVAIDPHSDAAALVRPGHVFPLQARGGGVLERAGHAEAATDLARLAGLRPAGVLCEVLKGDGTLARGADLTRYCHWHQLKLMGVSAVIAQRCRTEKVVERITEAWLPTPFGDFQAVGYRAQLDGREHMALVCGDVAGCRDVLTRIHPECVTGDAFRSLRCGCGERLRMSLEIIAAEGKGVLVYLAQEGSGFGLVNNLSVCCIQERGDAGDIDAHLPSAAGLRDSGIGAQILADLGLSSIRVLTADLDEAIGVESYRLSITEQIRIGVRPDSGSERYLGGRHQRGHGLEFGDRKLGIA